MNTKINVQYVLKCWHYSVSQNTTFNSNIINMGVITDICIIISKCNRLQPGSVNTGKYNIFIFLPRCTFYIFNCFTIIYIIYDEVSSIINCNT